MGTHPLSLNERIDFVEILRLLNETTTDHFFLWDLQDERLYFTSSIHEKYNLPAPSSDGYSLQEWESFIFAGDRLAFQKNLEQIRQGDRQDLDVEFRLTDLEGNKIWIRFRGKNYESSPKHGKIIIGRSSDMVLDLMVNPLTGLLNADKLREDMEQFLAEKSQGCLIILDIDNFQNINLKHGKSYGNQVLKRITEILEQSVDIFIRTYHIDSDRFAINLTGYSTEETKALFAAIQKKLAPLCTISAGASQYGGGWATSSGMLYQYTENALDRAKQGGKNNLVFFSAKDYEKYIHVIDLRDELYHSIEHGFEGFYLCYQPQINSRTYEPSGAEALLRYQSPTRGVVSPDEFVPILEQTELICLVGQWVLETALTQCAMWRRYLPDFHISVNLSYTQLRKKDITETVLRILEKSGLPGNALTLEVTENIQLQDYRYYNQIFFQWQNAGIQISIDDFGSGYSSLNYLKSIDINETKIDRCFVSQIQHSAYNYRLLSNMIELAHKAKIQVCCEGVETEDELLALKELHPDILQGYLFAKPFTTEEFTQLYVTKEGPAYQQRMAQQAHLHHLEEKPFQKLPDTQKEENFETIVNTLDEIIYVCGLDNFELYYLNPAGRKLTQQQDYKGRKCYKVLYGRNDPCEFCTHACHKNISDKEDFMVKEIENTFLKRHFVIKGKTIPWQDSCAYLGLAIDMTEKELVTRGVQEQLNSEQLLTACSKTLIEEPDLNQAILKSLRLAGIYYNADRVYLSQQRTDDNMWHSTNIWRRDGIHLDGRGRPMVPAAHLNGLIERTEEGIVIADIDTLKTSNPELWELLNHFRIRRLLGAPIWKNQKFLGFINVENPRRNLHSNAQLCSLANLLADRLTKSDTEKRLNELLNCRYEDILQNTRLGLWVIRTDPEHNRHEMFADRIMRQILDIPENATPEECYQHWYERINDGYFHYVNLAMDSMAKTRHIVEKEYTWNHPVKGEMMVQSLGLRTEDIDGFTCLEGYLRVVSDTERTKFLPDGTSSEMFEYNERKQSIYFHTGRKLLAGSSKREENFPECWIQSEIIHPHFAEEFRSIFFQVEQNEDIHGLELLMKAKDGSYQWFKLKTRHIGQEQKDLSTIIVLIDPAGHERTMELEYMRKSDFYEAMLSETAAYAEVDVESGQLKTAGGLWAPYEEECRKLGEPFSMVMQRHISEVVHEDEADYYHQLLSTEGMRTMYREGDVTRTYSFQRKINDEYRWMKLVVHIFPERFSEAIYALLYLKDINEDKKRELAQEIAASRDPLTNVYNRKTFADKVTQHMMEEEDSSGALAILDLDDFKSINDNYGHLEGDKALKTLTQVLLATFRRWDIIGRLGGDEFLVFVKDVTEREILDKRMNQLYETLHKAGNIPLTCSIGISLVHKKDFSYDRSLKRADTALYRSKQNGKDTYTYFEDL